MRRVPSRPAGAMTATVAAVLPTLLAALLAAGCTAGPEAAPSPLPPVTPPPVPATPPGPASSDPLPPADRAALPAVADFPLSADVPLPGRSVVLDAYRSDAATPPAPGASSGESQERILLQVDGTLDAARAFHVGQLPAAGWTIVRDEVATTAEGHRAALLTAARAERRLTIRIAERPAAPGVLDEVVVAAP